MEGKPKENEIQVPQIPSLEKAGISIYEYALQSGNKTLQEYIEENKEMYNFMGADKESFIFTGNNEVIIYLDKSKSEVQRFNSNKGSFHGGYSQFLADSCACSLVMSLVGTGLVASTTIAKTTFSKPAIAAKDSYVISKVISSEYLTYNIQTLIIQKVEGVNKIRNVTESTILVLKEELAAKIIKRESR